MLFIDNIAQQVQNPLSEMFAVKCASELRTFWISKNNSVFTQQGLGQYLVISYITTSTGKYTNIHSK